MPNTIADELRRIACTKVANDFRPATAAENALRRELEAMAERLDAFAARLIVADPDTAEHVTLAIGDPERLKSPDFGGATLRARAHNPNERHIHTLDACTDRNTGGVRCMEPKTCPFLTPDEAEL